MPIIGEGYSVKIVTFVFRTVRIPRRGKIQVPHMNDSTKNRVDTIVRAMQDKKASGIVSLDLSVLGGGAVCDAFVVCDADSTTRTAAIAAGVEEATGRELGERPWRVQGREQALWIAMDYGDVMVHVFQTELRDFYRLEELWGDALRAEHTSED